MNASSISTSQPNLIASAKDITNPVENDPKVNEVRKKRNRHSPLRYGDAGQLDMSDSFEDILNLGDNSLDDISYAPPEKDVATVARDPIVWSSSAKKKKTDTASEIPKYVNLDDEFDSLSKSIPQSTAPSEKIPVSINGLPIIISDEIHYINENTNNDGRNVFNVCRKMSNQMDDLFARFVVLENMLLKNGSLNLKNYKPTVVKKIDNSRIFNVANRLPLQNMHDLKTFDKKLEDEEFRNIAVN